MSAGARRYVVPGRVELVGKHVDYAGGRSLTCAVDLAITAHARPLDAPLVRISDRTRRLAASVEVPLAPDVGKTRGAPRWSSYVIAVVRRFARDFPHARRGVEMELSSTLPTSAGVASGAPTSMR